MYVSGTLKNTDTVLVDIGTGYYVEKVGVCVCVCVCVWCVRGRVWCVCVCAHDVFVGGCV